MQENIQIRSLSLYDIEQKVVWLFASLIAISIGLYMYTVVSMITDAVAQRSAEASMRAEDSKIAELEAEYFALGKSVDLASAEARGYREVSKIEYVSRSPVITMLDHAR